MTDVSAAMSPLVLRGRPPLSPQKFSPNSSPGRAPTQVPTGIVSETTSKTADDNEDANLLGSPGHTAPSPSLPTTTATGSMTGVSRPVAASASPLMPALKKAAVLEDFLEKVKRGGDLTTKFNDLQESAKRLEDGFYNSMGRYFMAVNRVKEPIRRRKAAKHSSRRGSQRSRNFPPSPQLRAPQQLPSTPRTGTSFSKSRRRTPTTVPLTPTLSGSSRPSPSSLQRRGESLNRRFVDQERELNKTMGSLERRLEADAGSHAPSAPSRSASEVKSLTSPTSTAPDSSPSRKSGISSLHALRMMGVVTKAGSGSGAAAWSKLFTAQHECRPEGCRVCKEIGIDNLTDEQVYEFIEKMLESDLLKSSRKRIDHLLKRQRSSGKIREGSQKSGKAKKKKKRKKK